MSLEQALRENTEAIMALHTLLAGSTLNGVTRLNGVTAEPAQESEQKVNGQPESKQKVVADNVSYQTLRDKILKLSRNKGRDAASEVLSHFGAKRLPDVDPKDYSSLLVSLNELLECEDD